MKLLLSFIVIYFYLYARENPFLPAFYDKNKTKSVTIKKSKDGVKSITKRIFLKKNVKRIDKIIIEYIDDKGETTIQGVRMDNFKVINNYIDVTQSSKHIKKPKQEDRFNKYYQQYIKQRKKDLKEQSKKNVLNPFLNAK